MLKAFHLFNFRSLRRVRNFFNNKNFPNYGIKFTNSWSAKAVTLHCVRVHLKDGLICTDLHVNPTDTHQCLQMGTCSFHSHHCKTSICYTQALHLLQSEFLWRKIMFKSHPTNFNNIYWQGYCEQQLNTINLEIFCNIKSDWTACAP